MTSPAPNTPTAYARRASYSETALSGIYEISKIVTSPANLKVMLNNVVYVMSSFLDMRLAILVLLNKDGDPEIKVASSTELTIEPGETTDIPIPVIDQIVATATPLVVQNCARHPLFAGLQRVKNAGTDAVQTFIGVPIRVDAKVMGTLAIERVWQGSMEVRIDHDVRFLTMVANLVGQAVKLHRIVAEDRERLIVEQHRLAKELSTLKAVKPTSKLSGILGKSRALRSVTERIEQIAKSNAPVLIRGETGTGKELFARAIHELSSRKGKPFIKVNCAALPESVIESELFGHEKGAFTGAIATRKGRFELADGGTIFLDEIGEISPSFQAKLLRVLQEGEFERVGGQQTLKVNFRLICATNRNLEELVTQEKFRADLYYRISVVPLMLPPLRDRSGDIPELAAHFLRRFCAENGREMCFAPDAIEILTQCYFPGNVRELENCVRRTAAMAGANEIHNRDFACQQGHCLSAMLWKGSNGASPGFRSLPILPTKPPRANGQASPPPPEPPESKRDAALAEEEFNGHPIREAVGAGASDGSHPNLSRENLIQAMEKTGWVQAKAARLLGLTPRQIGYALKKHRIELKRY